MDDVIHNGQERIVICMCPVHRQSTCYQLCKFEELSIESHKDRCCGQCPTSQEGFKCYALHWYLPFEHQLYATECKTHTNPRFHVEIRMKPTKHKDKPTKLATHCGSEGEGQQKSCICLKNITQKTQHKDKPTKLATVATKGKAGKSAASVSAT